MTARKPGSTRKMFERHGVGKDQTPEYRAWAQIIQRCNNTRDPAFRNYGARGIRICAKWRNSFLTFLADVGPRPSAGYSIDRIDNDGHYEPGNCRWATRSEQNNNRRGNVVVNVDGFNETLTEACRRYGFKVTTIKNRMNRRGLTARQAIDLGRNPRRKDWRGGK